MIPSSRTLEYKNLLGGIFMSRKNKVTPIEKLKAVEEYLNYEIKFLAINDLSGDSLFK